MRVSRLPNNSDYSDINNLFYNMLNIKHYDILQLMLTLMLLTIIVYCYTVIAFNFFRKFYVSEEDDEVDKKCHDMLTVR